MEEERAIRETVEIDRITWVEHTLRYNRNAENAVKAELVPRGKPKIECMDQVNRRGHEDNQQGVTGLVLNREGKKFAVKQPQGWKAIGG
jgi:hypothetical protein